MLVTLFKKFLLWLVTKNAPLKLFNKKSSNQFIEFISKWLVGSSSKSKSGFFKINAPKNNFLCSPPDKLLISSLIFNLSCSQICLRKYSSFVESKNLNK